MTTEQLSLFDLDEPAEATAEVDYRVLVQGEQVGQGGCGLTLWAPTEDDALSLAYAELQRWPGQRVAHVDRIEVKITGPKKADREFSGVTRVRSIYWRGDA